jgi:putative peptidoglycan lipid II flippase
MAKSKSLLKSSYVVASMTVITRLIGLIRETVNANLFGASGSFDAFLMAFRIPNFLRRLSAEGSFSQAFVPVLSEYRATKTKAEAKLFIDRMAGTLSLAVFILTVICILAAPLIVLLFAPGYLHDPHRFGLTTSMLRITFPYLFFISLTSFAGSILNSYDEFWVPAITPALLNISLIVVGIYLSPYCKDPVTSLAWGTFIGGILQLAFQIPFLKRLKLLPHPKIFWQDPGVRRVLKLMLPAILGVSVAQISLFIDTIFASFLQVGSVTWLYYSDRLINFPMGVFGIAIATAVLPHLSRQHAMKSAAGYSAALDWSIRSILLIALPSAVGMFMLAGPIISTVIGYGKFSPFDIEMASRSVMAFAVGLPGMMLIKLLASGFYSKQDIKTPVRIAIICLITNMAANAILIFPLKHAGLALGTTITSSLNSYILYRTLCKRGIFTPSNGWGKYIFRVGSASLAMILVIWFMAAKLPVWINWNWHQRVVHLGIILTVAAIVYLATLLITGMRWHDIKFEEA